MAISNTDAFLLVSLGLIYYESRACSILMEIVTYSSLVNVVKIHFVKNT